jgi:hypothetical protein
MCDADTKDGGGGKRTQIANGLEMTCDTTRCRRRGLKAAAAIQEM